MNNYPTTLPAVDRGGNPGRVFPIRVQLSRKKGFNLQRVSMELNGLPCAVVSRPSKWGNPYSLKFYSAAEAVANFRVAVRWLPEFIDLEPLRGKNLACWCKPSEPCHADVLLELANA